jgi:hypothetical protein
VAFFYLLLFSIPNIVEEHISVTIFINDYTGHLAEVGEFGQDLKETNL